MNQITLRPWFYRNAEQIKLVFEEDQDITLFLQAIPGLIWSSSKACWYMKFSKKNVDFLKEKLSSRAIVDTHLMIEFIRNLRKINRKFAWGTFLTVLLIIAVLTAASQEFYWRLDTGTLGTGFFPKLMANSFMIFRFPMLTIFWGHFGGIKSWTTVIFYLFINCSLYAFIIERLITPLMPKKNLIKDMILRGEIEIDI